LKLLLDENLSPKLIPRLAPLFSDLLHVRDVGLKQAADEAIWEWAKVSGYSIVTTDSDFVRLSRRLGWPPKVIHIVDCNFASSITEQLLRRNAIRIAELDKNPALGVLALRL
jgi:predicted nuclease of predicted toxin-antitoxin system